MKLFYNYFLMIMFVSTADRRAGYGAWRCGSSAKEHDQDCSWWWRGGRFVDSTTCNAAGETALWWRPCAGFQLFDVAIASSR